MTKMFAKSKYLSQYTDGNKPLYLFIDDALRVEVKTFIYKLLRKMHCFLPFEIYRLYAVYSNASCLLCSLFHGQWILGGPPLLLGLVVFIYKQHESRALFALLHAG